MTFGSKRALGVLACAASLLLLTGCIDLSTFEVEESNTSAATFQGLADGGGFVVLSSTGPTDTVPGAGWWRVDRSTGAAVALPGEVDRLSPDGSSALLADGSLWHDDGTVTTEPGVYSEDLRYRLAETGGALVVHSVETGAVVDVDAVFARPAGTTAVIPVAVSNDGRSVAYQLKAGSVTTADRFAHLDAATPLDLPHATDITYMMAARGRIVARADLEIGVYEDPNYGPVTVNLQVDIDLIDIVSGSTVATETRTFLPPTDIERSNFELLGISDNGKTVWSVEERFAADHGLACFGSPAPIVMGCVKRSTLTAVNIGRPSVHVDLAFTEIEAFDITAAGDHAVASLKHTFTHYVDMPVRMPPLLLRRTEGIVGQLDQGPTIEYSSTTACQYAGVPTAPCTVPIVGAHVEISDDGRVAAGNTMSGPGWYDYSRPS